MEIVNTTEELYKRDSKGKIRFYRGEVGQENGKYYKRAVTGLNDGKLVESGWREVEQKNIGKVNETSLHEQALAEITADAKKKSDRGYFNDINKVDTYDKIKPMLASKHEDAKYDFENKTYYTQPKLYGIRCIAKSDGLWTRAGKELISVPHINDELKTFFEKFPDAILDGELYNHELRENFNKITSLVRKTKPEPWDIKDSARLVEYHVYDVISHTGVFSERMDWITEQAEGIPKFTNSVILVETQQIYNQNMMDDIYGAYLEDGFEGQMIRIDDVYQMNKRSKFLIKRKEFLTDEYDVIKIEEGKGNWSGHIKRFVMQTENGQEFGAGVRGTQKVLKDLFENGPNPDWCTLRYFSPTPDCIPRFPVVIDWGVGKRED